MTTHPTEPADALLRIWANAQEWPKGTGRIEVYAASKPDPDDPSTEYVRADLLTALLAERDALAAQLAAAQAAHERIFAWGDGADPIAGTWGLSRYPDNAVAYVREDLLAAAEIRARDSALDALAAYGQAAEAHEARLAAEAKLATARGEALEEAARVCEEYRDDMESGDAKCCALNIRALAKGGAT